MNLNRGQVFSIIIAIFGVLVASTAQLTDLFGPAVTKYMVSASTLLMTILSSVNAILGGQSSQIAAVQQMPGVEKIIVNSQANGTLAMLAVDPTQDKIEALPTAQAKIEAIAKAVS